MKYMIVFAICMSVLFLNACSKNKKNNHPVETDVWEYSVADNLFKHLPSVSGTVFHNEKFDIMAVTDEFVVAGALDILTAEAQKSINENKTYENRTYDTADWKIFTQLITHDSDIETVMALIGEPVINRPIYEISSNRAFNEYHFQLAGGSWLCLAYEGDKLSEKILSHKPLAKWR